MKQRIWKISFEVKASPGTNDHEVRIFLDGSDLIDGYCPEMMGMDPDEILTHRLLGPSDTVFEATIARCGCGVVGCGSSTVRITTESKRVIWDSWDGGLFHRNPGTVAFEKNGYLDALNKAINDHSWETPDRTAARLLASRIDHAVLSKNQLKYEWASGRLKEGEFTVSLLGPRSYHQILLHVPWSNESPSEIGEKAAALLKTDPREWTNVSWYSQEKKPPFDGPGWIHSK